MLVVTTRHAKPIWARTQNPLKGVSWSVLASAMESQLGSWVCLDLKYTLKIEILGKHTLPRTEEGVPYLMLVGYKYVYLLKEKKKQTATVLFICIHSYIYKYIYTWLILLKLFLFAIYVPRCKHTDRDIWLEWRERALLPVSPASKRTAMIYGLFLTWRRAKENQAGMMAELPLYKFFCVTMRPYLE